MKRVRIIIILACLATLFSCEEAKRFAISAGDTTIPQTPIILDSSPLPGGARVYFKPQDDEDFLYVEAVYTNTQGEEVKTVASYFADHVDVLGFSKAGPHDVFFHSVDRAGNQSADVKFTVTADEPPLTSVANTINLIPSFGALMMNWQNEDKYPMYVYAHLNYTLDGEVHDYTTSFSTYSTETRSIDSLKLFKDEPIKATVWVKDKYGNESEKVTSTVILPVDHYLDKSGWTLPEPGTIIGGVEQANGSFGQARTEFVIDGITEGNGDINYYYTSAPIPWNIIIDLGQEYQLSRVVTWQRYTALTTEDIRGSYYGEDNVLAYNIYVWDKEASEWVFISRHDIKEPVVRQEMDYKVLGDAGDEAYFYPDIPSFSIPTRFFRLEALKGSYITEISLYGKAVNQ